MLDMTTTKHLADVVHGTIHYSGIEGEVIGTPAFNRLHNILQSSVVYLTYPSNKVKRFEHSVGTMKIAGDLLYHSVCNTENGEEYNKFFQEIKNEIINWRRETKHDDVSFIRNDIYCSKYTEKNILQAPVPSCRLYNMYTPGNLKNEDRLAYFVTFQAVRLCGLLHDVGHLPHSHVLESFLEKLFNEITSKEENELNEKELYFKQILSNFIIENKHKPVDAIHEKFGVFLFSKIFKSITDSLPMAEDETRIFLALVIYFSKKILASNENIDISKKNIFTDLHRITSGVLDADRLDYCNRDLNAVGIKRGFINYNRLLSSIKIKEIIVKERPLSNPKGRQQTTFNGFCFCPAAKHVNEIENLISLRWDDFFYINYHHRVHKHEILMEEVLIELANKELSNNEPSIDLTDSIILPLNISSIWEILKQIIEDRPIEYLLIQLDDNWLNTLLKKEFFSIYQKTYTLYSDHANDPLWHRFDEIISSKKHYCSLLKGTDSFREFDERLFDEVKKLIKKNKDKGSAQKSKILQETEKKNYLELISKIGGFYFGYVLRAKPNLKEFILDTIEKSINAVLKEKKNQKYNILNVIIRKCQFGLGYTTLTNPVYIYSINGAYDKLEHYSQQLSELQRKQNNSSVFHCYYLPTFDTDKLDYKEVDQEKIMKLLCKCSAEVIYNLFINKGKEVDESE